MLSPFRPCDQGGVTPPTAQAGGLQAASERAVGASPRVTRLSHQPQG